MLSKHVISKVLSSNMVFYNVSVDCVVRIKIRRVAFFTLPLLVKINVSLRKKHNVLTYSETSIAVRKFFE